MTLEELKDKYGSELVLCISNKKLETTSMNLKDAISYYGFLSLRYKAELDFESKQIIPYIVIKRGDKIYTTTRIQGDPRLVGKMSIGAGGHIDHKDVVVKDSRIDVAKTAANCMNRELLEELAIDGSVGEYQFITDFCDDSVEVSRVHLCLLHVLEVAEDTTVEIKETEKLSGEWLTVEELRETYGSLENWSQIALDLLFPKTTKKRKNKKVTETEELSEE